MEILISLIIGVVLIELYVWLDPLARWLIHRAAKKLPEHRQAEFIAQWEADLAAVPNSIVKVCYVLRDCVFHIGDIQQIMFCESFEEIAGRDIWGKHLKEMPELIRNKITKVISTNSKSANPYPMILKIGENVDGEYDLHVRMFAHRGRTHIGLNLLCPNPSSKE